MTTECKLLHDNDNKKKRNTNMTKKKKRKNETQNEDCLFGSYKLQAWSDCSVFDSQDSVPRGDVQAGVKDRESVECEKSLKHPDMFYFFFGSEIWRGSKDSQQA